jgi:hypothetical protein
MEQSPASRPAISGLARNEWPHGRVTDIAASADTDFDRCDVDVRPVARQPFHRDAPPPPVLGFQIGRVLGMGAEEHVILVAASIVRRSDGRPPCPSGSVHAARSMPVGAPPCSVRQRSAVHTRCPGAHPARCGNPIPVDGRVVCDALRQRPVGTAARSSPAGVFAVSCAQLRPLRPGHLLWAIASQIGRKQGLYFGANALMGHASGGIFIGSCPRTFIPPRSLQG